jgi:hypothetical protein
MPFKAKTLLRNSRVTGLITGFYTVLHFELGKPLRVVTF